MNTRPKVSTCGAAVPLWIASNTNGMSSEPVAPYIIDRPYSRNPLAMLYDRLVPRSPNP